MADAYYNTCPDAGGSNDYARGLVVGVVSTLMAMTGMTYEKAISTMADSLPVSFSTERLPDAFCADIIKCFDGKVRALSVKDVVRGV